MDAPTALWPGELVSLGDREVFVRAVPGEGAPGLFLHGLTGSATNWTDLMGLLSGEVAGRAIDMPGFGFSPPPPDRDYSVDGQARTVVRLLEASDGPVHLFGNSLGGAVATRVAGARPDLVRTLTLISPALPDLRVRYGSARIVAATLPGLGPWALAKLVALPPERRVQNTLDMCFADSSRVHPDRLMEYVEEVRRRDELDYNVEAVLASARGIVSAYLKRSLWRDAARVTAPTLVIYGGQDRLVDPRNAARAGRTFKNSRVVVLPAVGHVAQMERPESVAREFRALLEDMSPAAPY